MAISYHLNIKLEKSQSPHASTPGRSPSITENKEKADALQLAVYGINMFAADNYKVTFILKAQSGEEMRDEGDGTSAGPPHNSVSHTFTSQKRGGCS